MAHELELGDFRKLGAFLAQHGGRQGGDGLFRGRAFAAGAGHKYGARAGFAYLVYDRFVPFGLMKPLHSFQIVH